MEKLELEQQELRDLRELVAGQVVVNQENPTAWYWMELGQRISRLIKE